MKCFIPLFVCIVFISSSSVARHVPSRFRIVVGFQRARLFSRRRRGRRRRTTTAVGAVFAQRERKIHGRGKKRQNDRFPVDRARWFPYTHRVSSFLTRHFLCLHVRVKSVTHRIRKDVLLLFRLLEYTLSLFLSEEEDAGECCVSSFFARSIVLRSVPVRRWSSKRRRLDDDFTGVVADVTEDDERRRERRKARCYSRVYKLQ